NYLPYTSSKDSEYSSFKSFNMKIVKQKLEAATVINLMQYFDSLIKAVLLDFERKLHRNH
ncbi:MAG: hypothetical protein ACK55Z_02955, partial [bacterium]